MKLGFYLLAVVASIITLMIGLNKGFLWLAFFAITPYLLTLFLLKISTHNTAIITAKTVTVFVVLVGLYFLLDMTYMEKKLGDKFSFLFMPIWQWTMLLVSGSVVYLSNAKESSSYDEFL